MPGLLWCLRGDVCRVAVVRWSGVVEAVAGLLRWSGCVSGKIFELNVAESAGFSCGRLKNSLTNRSGFGKSQSVRA